MIEWNGYDAERSWQNALDAANESYQTIPKGVIDYEKYHGQFRLTEMYLQLAQVHATNAQTEVFRNLYHCKMVCCQ